MLRALLGIAAAEFGVMGAGLCWCGEMFAAAVFGVIAALLAGVFARAVTVLRRRRTWQAFGGREPRFTRDEEDALNGKTVVTLEGLMMLLPRIGDRR
jgi:hypothetical protein